MDGQIPFQSALNWYVDVVGSVIRVEDNREQCDLMRLAEKVGAAHEDAKVILKTFENQLNKGNTDASCKGHGTWIAAACLLRYSHQSDYQESLQGLAPILTEHGLKLLKANNLA